MTQFIFSIRTLNFKGNPSHCSFKDNCSIHNDKGSEYSAISKLHVSALVSSAKKRMIIFLLFKRPYIIIYDLASQTKNI